MSWKNGKMGAFFTKIINLYLGILLSLSLLLFPMGCQFFEGEEDIVLATTTSVYDTGIINTLLDEFYQEHGIEVSVTARGTGAALELGKRGDAHLVLVHDPEQEKELVEQGFYQARHELMENVFVIIGPPGDPAGVSNAENIEEALLKIIDAGETFISRGDYSGTHMKEKHLFQNLVGTFPSEDNYLSIGQGMGDTVRMTAEKEAYTLSDYATYAYSQSMTSDMDLAVLYQSEEKILLNTYSLLVPAESKGKNKMENKTEKVERLIEFMTSSHAKQVMANYEINGEQLFYPLINNE